MNPLRRFGRTIDPEPDRSAPDRAPTGPDWPDPSGGPATLAARPRPLRSPTDDPPTDPHGWPAVPGPERAGPPSEWAPGAPPRPLVSLPFPAPLHRAGPAAAGPRPGRWPDPDRAAATALAVAFAVDYLSWDEADVPRRGRVLAGYLRDPGPDPGRLGWDGSGRQRAEFAVPGRTGVDPTGRLLVDVRVRVTPYRPAGGDGPDPEPAGRRGPNPSPRPIGLPSPDPEPAGRLDRDPNPARVGGRDPDPESADGRDPAPGWAGRRNPDPEPVRGPDPSPEPVGARSPDPEPVRWCAPDPNPEPVGGRVPELERVRWCAPDPNLEPVGMRSPEPEREPASTPAGAPAPTARGWRDQASRWALLTVPVLRCGSRLAIDRDDRPAVPIRPDPAPPATGTEA